MRKILGIILLVVSLPFSLLANECCIPYYDSRVQFISTLARMNYNAEGENSFNGDIDGFQGIYEYRPLNNVYAGALLAWQQGDLAGSLGTRSITYVDAEERVGYTFGLDRGFMQATLFSGLGFHYLKHRYNPNTLPSIAFAYSEFYVPLGYSVNYEFSPSFALGVNCTWMIQFASAVGIDPLNGANWTLSNSLNNILVELPLDFTFPQDSHFHVRFAPFFQHWEDGPTTAVTTTGIALGLPRNFYNSYGLNFNIAYSF